MIFLVQLLSFSVFSAEENYAVSKIPPSLLAGASAVKRNELIRFEIKNPGSAIYYYKTAVTILNENGDEYAGWQEDYDDKFTTIRSVNATLFDGNGKKIRSLKKDFSFDTDMSNTSIDSLKTYDAPVSVKFDFKMSTDEDIIYLNPVFEDAYKENPFKAAERKYPVEMPYKMNESFVLNMDIPKGYRVEEVPKSARVKLNEDEGLFEYLVAKDENTIQLRSTLKLNKATFLPEDYQTLRDFFGYIVKKHSEQIVFKKIK